MNAGIDRSGRPSLPELLARPLNCQLSQVFLAFTGDCAGSAARNSKHSVNATFSIRTGVRCIRMHRQTDMHMQSHVGNIHPTDQSVRQERLQMYGCIFLLPQLLPPPITLVEDLAVSRFHF